MSQFYVCDWCGEPIKGNPVDLTISGGNPVMYGTWHHYHGGRGLADQCLNYALSALRDAQEENRMQDVPR